MKDFLEWNDNENSLQQNLWGTLKAPTCPIVYIGPTQPIVYIGPYTPYSVYKALHTLYCI